MIVCRKCNNQEPDGVDFCGSCGSYLPYSGESVQAPAPAVETMAEGDDEDPEHRGIVATVKTVLGLDHEAEEQQRQQEQEAREAAEVEQQRVAAEERARAEQLAVAQADIEARTAADAEDRARAQAEEAARQQHEAEQAALQAQEAERRARHEADMRAQEASNAHQQAAQALEPDAQARAEADARTAEIASSQAQAAAQAEAQAAAEADERARRNAEMHAQAMERAEAETKARQEAEERAARALEEESRARAEVEERTRRASAMIATPASAPPITTPSSQAAAANPPAADGAPAGTATDATPGAQQPAAVPPSAPAPSRRPTHLTKPTSPLKEGDRICGQCGEGNDPARNFCRRCGFSLAESAVVSVSWWRRLFSRRRKAPPVAGTRPTVKAGLPSSAGIVRKTTTTTKRVLKTVLPLAVVAVVVLAVIPFHSPIKTARINAVNWVKSLLGQPTPVHFVGTPIATSPTSLANHPPFDAMDGANNTFWAVPFDANGTSILFELQSPTKIDQIGFLSGAEAPAQDFEAYAAPKQIVVKFFGTDNNPVYSTPLDQPITLKDVPTLQAEKFPNPLAKFVEVQILSTWQGTGTTAGDVALTEVEPFTP